MKYYRASANQRFHGLFTDLFIIGTSRGAVGASDFTAADTTQTITLLTPAAGDIVTYPMAVVYTKKGFVAPGLTDVSIDLGYSGLNIFTRRAPEVFPDAQLLHTFSALAGQPVTAAGSAGPKVFDGAIPLTAVVNTTGANLNQLTAGELWIYLCLVRLREALEER